jgi:predicted nicotinamide N-methyase
VQKTLQKTSERSILNVLELGAGCGIFGIALAQMRPRTTVTLTDLPEAEEIITRNISHAHPAEGSRVHFKVLDWDDRPREILADREVIDLILVSDCTYNADSLPFLVRTLDQLIRTSPAALILVSLKRRHESESIFFGLMAEAALSIAEKNIIWLPSAYTEESEQGDPIELYTFRRAVDS